LATEYEQLLTQMISERKAKLEAERAKRMDKKKIDGLLADIGFVEVELERYRRGLNLFRTKDPLPRVGRWGKAESSQPSEASP
jgi:16S rRNA C1402 N4-methylase RsmH